MYSARGYGVFDQLRDRFQDPDDPFEYVPTRLPALGLRTIVLILASMWMLFGFMLWFYLSAFHGAPARMAA